MKLIQALSARFSARTSRVMGQSFKVEHVRSKMLRYDQPLLAMVMFLLAFGTVMVYSASVTLPDSPRYAQFYGGYFLIRHCVAIAVATVVGLFAFRIPMQVWERQAPKLFLFALLLLVLVLLPHIGKGVNGARRWIALGFFNFQPSELMKLAVVLYAANYTVRKQQYMHSLTKGLVPMGIAVVVVGLLLLAEPDMGAFIVIAGIAFGILFIGGISGKIFGALAALGLGTFTTLIALSPWRRERIFAYLDPWREDYALGKAYQLTHSLIAFGRGGWSGVGLGGSVEKLNYLPEAHTDFILAVLGEELGFIGVLFVIVAIFWLVRRAFQIGRFATQCDKIFSGLTAKGIGIWLGWQAFINIGVNLGLLPTKGLTLPLLSYGGSGILVNGIAVAILLRIDWENRILMRGGNR